MDSTFLIKGFIVEGKAIKNESTGEEIPDVPFSALKLSTRPYNVLIREAKKICQAPDETVCVSDLLRMREDDLLHLRNLGLTSAKEIMAELEKYLNDPEGYQTDGAADIPEAKPSVEQNHQYDPWFMDENGNILKPSFFQYAESSGKLNEQQKEVLRCRMKGESLQDAAAKLNISRQRVRQIEMAAFHILVDNHQRQFAEDQFAFLYQTYQVPRDFFLKYLKQGEETLHYLAMCYDPGKLAFSDAEKDENLNPEIREAIREYLQKDTIWVDGQRILLSRNDIEEYLIRNHCQDDTTLEQFAALYDQFIAEHGLTGSDLAGSRVYLTRFRINRFVNAPNILWKQNQRMRYYDTSRDMTELLDVLDLGQYRNIELSARKFLLDYPELMKKYDIRDEYELHNLLKKIHAEKRNETLVFERMPFLLFGSFDRNQAVKELIYTYSPLTADELARQIALKYGANIDTVKSTWLKAVAVYYHHGMYVRPVEDDPIDPAALPSLSESQKAETAKTFSAAADGKSGKKKILTPKEKLFRRIQSEFGRKKLIGDIVISDEEFEILLSYLRSQCKYLLTQCELFECDEMLCVALVQIGIRYYSDGSYWPFVKKILNAPQYKDSHFNWLGSSFQRFLREKGKLLVPDKKNLANILMHGFVADKRANDFFDFLFMFYDIDLCRDIHRLKEDKTLMSGLMDNIKSTGTKGHTYKLLEHTADAIRCNEKGGRIRMNRCLKLIDRAFWDQDDLPKQSGNRLTRYFLEWSSRSEMLKNERKARKRSALRGGGWSPYLKYKYQQDEFRIILPAHLIRSEKQPLILWEVRYGGIDKFIPAETCEAVTGYMTEEQSYLIETDHIFDSFEITLLSDGEKIRKWKIQKDQIRFFDLAGDQLETSSLRTGEAISFSHPDYQPESEAIKDKRIYGDLLILEYHFEDGDLIIFPDRQVLSIGRRPAEGLLTRNQVKNVFAQEGAERIPVWSAPPSVFARIHPKAKNGTRLTVNGKTYRLFEDQQPAKGVHVFDLRELTPEEGIQIALSCFEVSGNGEYHVELDIPNDHANRKADFMLINGLSFSFDDEPYIFRETGVLCIPEGTGLKAYDHVIRQENMDGQDRFAFEIPEDDDWFRLRLDDTPILFSIPKLSYRFQGEEKWQTKLHMPVWHKDLPRILEVRFPSDNIQLLLDEEGNEEDDDEQHIINYQKLKEKDLFVCDLGPFASYYGRRVAVRRLYIQVPGMEKPIKFLNIYTRSVFISAILKADYANDMINGEFDIHGKAQYFADVWYRDELLNEKEPIVDGKLSIHTALRNGTYKIDVYETDDDGFGFDDPVYELLGSHSTELINPSDLSGRHIQITHLEDKRSDSYLRLKRIYRLFDLRPLEDLGKGYYAGHMVITSDTSGAYRNDYEACIHIPDPEELTKAYFFVLDYYRDKYSFIYDNDRYIMTKNEDKSVKGVFKYRRFRYLMEEDYIFRISFIEKPQNLDNMVQIERENYQKHFEAEKQKKLEQDYQHKQDPLCRPVTHLGLSIQTINALTRAQILTSTDLYSQAFSDKGLLGIRNMGRRNMEECIYGLRKAGYSI